MKKAIILLFALLLAISTSLCTAMASEAPVKASTDDVWINLIEEDMKEFDYDTVLQKLEPYLADYPAARAVEAFIYSQMPAENGKDLFRYRFAALVAQGEDPQVLLDPILQKVYGFNIINDYGGMAFNSYTYGDYSTTIELLYYVAEGGNRNAKELICFAALTNPVFSNVFQTLPNATNIANALISYFTELGQRESDPVALYITAEAINMFQGQIKLSEYSADQLYSKAAALFEMIIRDGKLEMEPSEEGDFALTLTNFYLNGQMNTDNPLVCYYIGSCYEYGDPPIKKDYNEAAKWYKEAADLNLPDGAYRYGYLLLSGRAEGTFEDCVNYLYYAADAKNAEAAYYLGVIMLGTTYNDEAEEYIKYAAECGHKYAQMYLNDGAVYLDEEAVNRLNKWRGE